MNVYVINLASRTDRLAATTELFSRFGLSFERIDAIDGRNLSHAQIQACHRRGALGVLAAGDIGCFLSHREAWKRIANGSEPYGIVMEDDVLFGSRLAQLVKSSIGSEIEFDVLKLDRSGNKRLLVLLSKNVHENQIGRFKELQSKHTGTGAYAISRECAREALEHSAPFEVSVDHYLFNRNNSRFARKIYALQLQPAAVKHGLIDRDKGDIQAGRERQKTHDLSYWRRELVRGFYEIKRIPIIAWNVLRGSKLEKIEYQAD